MTRQTHYPSDLSDIEWKIAQEYIPPAKPGGRPRKADMRAVLDAIYYITKAGCQRSMLPRDFPPKSTVNAYFTAWKRDGTWPAIQAGLRDRVRAAEGLGPSTTAAVDSQSIDTPAGVGGDTGFDGGKNVWGRKRHILADSCGFLVAVVVTAASVADAAGAEMVLGRICRPGLPELGRVFADSAYNRGHLWDWVAAHGWYKLEVVHRPPGAKGWVRLPKRWIVERTIGWMMHSRRLVRDYEKTTESAEAFIYASQTRILLRRLAKHSPQPTTAQRIAA